VTHRLSNERRKRILLTCHEPEVAGLSLRLIVPLFADRGLVDPCGEDCAYGSERSFYLLLHGHRQSIAEKA